MATICILDFCAENTEIRRKEILQLLTDYGSCLENVLKVINFRSVKFL